MSAAFPIGALVRVSAANRHVKTGVGPPPGREFIVIGEPWRAMASRRRVGVNRMRMGRRATCRRHGAARDASGLDVRAGCAGSFHSEHSPVFAAIALAYRAIGWPR